MSWHAGLPSVPQCARVTTDCRSAAGRSRCRGTCAERLRSRIIFGASFGSCHAAFLNNTPATARADLSSCTNGRYVAGVVARLRTCRWLRADRRRSTTGGRKRGVGGLIDASHWGTRESCGARGPEGAEEARTRPRHGSAPPRRTAIEPAEPMHRDERQVFSAARLPSFGGVLARVGAVAVRADHRPRSLAHDGSGVASVGAWAPVPSGAPAPRFKGVARCSRDPWGDRGVFRFSLELSEVQWCGTSF